MLGHRDGGERNGLGRCGFDQRGWIYNECYVNNNTSASPQQSKSKETYLFKRERLQDTCMAHSRVEMEWV